MLKEIIALARKMTNANLHTEGVCLLAALSQDVMLINRAFTCRFAHFDEGHVSPTWARERDDVAAKAWTIIRENYPKWFCDELWEAF